MYTGEKCKTIEPTHAEVLERYREKKPKAFHQYDAFDVGRDDQEGIMRPDQDGFCRWGGGTPHWELMTGATVRVLIPVGTDKARAVLGLKKLLHWIEHQPFPDIEVIEAKKEEN